MEIYTKTNLKPVIKNAMDIINWIIKNKEFLGITATFLGLIIPFATFILTKNKEQKQINFENFHKNLMKDLVNLEGEIGLDQQVAIIYELRNYPKYFPVIRRILEENVIRWSADLKNKPNLDRLITEAKLTINFSSKNFLKRIYMNYIKKTDLK